MQRYVCIHGHFYQPPRENPWLEAIEQQDSAFPYHDWNERINAECYGPNARSRILDNEGRIRTIANNYARLSYNVGPTLLKWLDDSAPETYNAIIDADRDSMERFSGHGSAIAQPYNHMIMPLSNSRDRYTQALWGIRDFEKRFGRKPEGMWLPETAVDLETLDILAALGIKFTILEPGQARRIKGQSSRTWTDVAASGGIDPTRAYTCRLPSGRGINLFFYDGPISRAVAFENLLDSGETFVNRLLSGFSDERQWPQVMHIATDGESYGHHHRFGDMALAYTLDQIERAGFAKLTNYSEYLSLHPAEWQVEINENTSWSCAHGVERWKSNCGCNTGGHPDWNQEWRAPLRSALDWLRDDVAPKYEQAAGQLFRDPWEARNDYIDVILNRDDENVAAFFRKHGAPALDESRWTTGLELLELQRHAMLMYTSCGWFFDDLSGIETVQVIQYAGRVVQLAQKLFGDHIEEQFLSRLAEANSNLPERGEGSKIYEDLVRPAIVDLAKVGAHYAISSLFEEYPRETRIFCYNVDAEEYEQQTSGTAQMALGRVRLTSIITRESDTARFGVLHFGDHNISAGVRSHDDADFSLMKAEALEAFTKADLPEALRVLDRYFGELTYSLRTLFKDEQRKVLNSILGNTVSEAEASYRQIFEHHAPLMRFLMDIGFPLPSSFQAAAELVINANLRRLFEEDRVEPDRVRSLLEDATTWSVQLDAPDLAFAAERTLERLGSTFVQNPEDAGLLVTLETTVTAIKQLPFTVDLWEAQNDYWTVVEAHLDEFRKTAGSGDQPAQQWLDNFRTLGATLSFALE